MADLSSIRNGSSPAPSPAEPPPDAPIDVGWIAGAVRRDARLIIVIVLVISGVVLVVSSLSPVRYQASARIADDPVATDPLDTAASDRRLATFRELAVTPTVLNAAATRLDGETERSLAAKVSATVDPAAGILDIAVTDGDAGRAARGANAVAAAFLDAGERAQRDKLTEAQQRLANEIDVQRRRGATAATIDALRSQFGDMAAAGVMAGPGMTLVQPATTPSSPYTPHPLRSTLFAAIAALLVAVLVALARERLRRRRPDAAEISATLEAPLLAALPVAHSRRRTRDPESIDGAMVEEAALQAAVRAALPPRTQRVVLVHGVGRDSHAPVVAAALARSFSWAGHATALVRLDAPGELSAQAERWAPDVPAVVGEDLEGVLHELKGSTYRYVVVQSPRSGGGTQLRRIAADVSGVILVAQLGVATEDEALAARRLVDALALVPLGLVLACSPADRPSVTRGGFAAAPPRRTGTTNRRPTREATAHE
jgi:capsular polysaccharide biosynthesis protein